MGSRAKTDPSFSAQFKGMPLKDSYRVKADGGDVDALSGATITSRGVCGAVTNAVKLYEHLKDQIIKKMKT
jgi:electron transport complex protein RnfG